MLRKLRGTVAVGRARVLDPLARVVLECIHDVRPAHCDRLPWLLGRVGYQHAEGLAGVDSKGQPLGTAPAGKGAGAICVSPKPLWAVPESLRAKKRRVFEHHGRVVECELGGG